jgi:hypothetical protein
MIRFLAVLAPYLTSPQLGEGMEGGSVKIRVICGEYIQS